MCARPIMRIRARSDTEYPSKRKTIIKLTIITPELLRKIFMAKGFQRIRFSFDLIKRSNQTFLPKSEITDNRGANIMTNPNFPKTTVGSSIARKILAINAIRAAVPVMTKIEIVSLCC